MAARTPQQVFAEDYAPRIREIRGWEANRRDAALFDLPARVGPFRLRQMLVRDATALYAVGHPLFAGHPAGDCTAAQVIAFVRLLTTGGRAWAGLKCVWTLSRPKAAARLLAALDEYVRETFIDWPEGTGGTGPDLGHVNGYLFSGVVHLVAAHYHWSEAAILAIPLRRLLIYRKHIIADYDYKAGKRVLDTSAAERRLRQEWAARINGRRN